MMSIKTIFTTLACVAVFAMGAISTASTGSVSDVRNSSTDYFAKYTPKVEYALSNRFDLARLENGETVRATEVRQDGDDVGAQSVSISLKDGAISVTYLHDGYNGFVGLSGRLTELAPRVYLNAIVVKPTNESDSDETWLGTVLQWRVLDSTIKIDLMGGLKGFDLSRPFDEQRIGRDSFVFGIGISVPVR